MSIPEVTKKDPDIKESPPSILYRCLDCGLPIDTETVEYHLRKEPAHLVEKIIRSFLAHEDYFCLREDQVNKLNR